MDSVLCFTNKFCPHKGEVRGFDNPQVNPKPQPYFTCNAKTLEHMRVCVMREDRDLKKYGVKILVEKDGKTKSWDPKKTLVQRLDRDEQIDCAEYDQHNCVESGKFEV